VSKKLEEKQRRRLAEEKKKAEQKRAQRRRNLLTTGIAIIVAAGVVWLVLSDTSRNEDTRRADPIDNGVTPDEAGCGDVETAEPQEAEHIAQGDEHEPYNTNPPTSGPHYGSPLAPIDSGFYTEEIEAEKVIHNLEHGQIVIYYNLDAPEETLDEIEQLTEQEPLATLAVPWNDIEPPSQFVLAAWGSLQECVQVSQEVVDEFRTDFQGQGPEQVGVPAFEG
jgi:hypothetical protein